MRLRRFPVPFSAHPASPGRSPLYSLLSWRSPGEARSTFYCLLSCRSPFWRATKRLCRTSRHTRSDHRADPLAPRAAQRAAALPWRAKAGLKPTRPPRGPRTRAPTPPRTRALPCGRIDELLQRRRAPPATRHLRGAGAGDPRQGLHVGGAPALPSPRSLCRLNPLRYGAPRARQAGRRNVSPARRLFCVPRSAFRACPGVAHAGEAGFRI